MRSAWGTVTCCQAAGQTVIYTDRTDTIKRSISWRAIQLACIVRVELITRDTSDTKSDIGAVETIIRA